MKLSPAFFYFLPLQLKYSLQYSVVKHPRYISSLCVHHKVNTHTKPQIKIQFLNDLISMSLHCKQGERGSEMNGCQHLLNLFALNIFVKAHLVFQMTHSPFVIQLLCATVLSKKYVCNFGFLKGSILQFPTELQMSK